MPCQGGDRWLFDLAHEPREFEFLRVRNHRVESLLRLKVGAGVAGCLQPGAQQPGSGCRQPAAAGSNWAHRSSSQTPAPPHDPSAQLCSPASL